MHQVHDDINHPQESQVSLQEISDHPGSTLRDGKILVCLRPGKRAYILAYSPSCKDIPGESRFERPVWYWANLGDQGNRWRDPASFEKALANYPGNSVGEKTPELYLVDSLHELGRLLTSKMENDQ